MSARARITELVVALAARLVPRSARRRWLAEWRAELRHLEARRAGTPGTSPLRRSLGSVPDALWIRCHSWSPDMLRQDLRFAVRTYLERPGFTLVALLTLALGIGANTAAFGLVDAVLLEALPYPDPDRLVRLYGTHEERGLTRINMNPNDLIDLRERSETLAGVAYQTRTSATFLGDEAPERLTGSVVAAGFFEVMGVAPALGRGFLPREEVAGADRPVVLSWASWQRLLGGDPEAVGRRIELSGEPHVVVGVAPQGFQGPFFPEPAALWTTWPIDPDNRGGHFMRAVARLAPGVDLATAREEVEALGARIAREHDKPERSITLVTLRESVVGEARPVLLMLLGAVAFLLLIGCLNLASLLLARGAGRRRELAVRMALGAGRGRIVRQLLTESLLLALVGGLLGLVLGRVLIGAAVGVLGAELPATVLDAGLDTGVVLFTLGLATLTGVAFGLLPALQLAPGRSADVLREGRGADAGSSSSGLRAGLIVAEVALTVVLLVGAGLTVRSLATLVAVDPGFDPAGMLTFQVSVPESRYPDTAEQVPRFYQGFLERIEALPGVESAAAINRLPLGNSQSCDLFVLEGWPNPEPGEYECAEERVVAGDYFATMGMQVRSGRPLRGDERAAGDPVIVVSREMVDRFMPGEDPLGRGFKWGFHDDGPFRRVVGVVENVRHGGLADEPMPEIYMPQAQYPFYRTMYVVVRTPGEPLSLAGPIRDVLAEVDPALPIFSVATMEELLSRSVLPQRLLTTLLSAFALLALGLACVGLYGVLAYLVSRRSREIGVRMALGAAPGNVRSLVLRQGMSLVGVGVLIGAAGAWALSGVLRGLLFGVEPTDPMTFAAVIACLLAVSLAASYVPARRATRLDPVASLRQE